MWIFHENFCHAIENYSDTFVGMYEDIIGITENLIAIIAGLGALYITTCFANNREKIRILINEMHDFKEMSGGYEVLETEKKVRLHSKMFLAYGIVGTLVYAFAPLFQIEECRVKRKLSKHSQHIPCGMITRIHIPENWNSFTYFIVAYLNQLYTCIVFSLLTLSITVLLCGLLMHTVNQIKFLKKRLLNSCTAGKNFVEIEKEVHFCVKYHQLIIK